MPLKPWMRNLLRFAGCYNLLVGFGLMVLYHETFKIIGFAKPPLMMFVQLVGILVGLFGVGYLMVASNPLQNKNILWLGLASKFLGSVVGLGYMFLGKVPPLFLPLLIVSDIVYLPFFWVIARRLDRIASGD